MPSQDPGIQLPQVKSCLFCWPLETGSKIIAWLMTIFGLLAVIVVGEALYEVMQKDYDIEEFLEFGFYFAINICSFSFAICLLKGVYEKNVTYVKQWVVWTTFEIILVFISIIFELVTPNKLIYLYSYIAGEPLYFCVTAYFLMVVFSYYKEQWPHASRDLLSLK